MRRLNTCEYSESEICNQLQNVKNAENDVQYV